MFISGSREHQFPTEARLVIYRSWFKHTQPIFGYQGEAITDFKTTIQQLRTQLSDSQQNAKQLSTELSSSRQVIRAHQQKHECETLYANGHVVDAANSLLDITRSINDDVKSDAIIMDWLSGEFCCH